MNTPRHHINALRSQALTLHKKMIDEARLKYEARHGTIAPSELLRLFAFDPEFAWLKPLTSLILDIDDRLDAHGDLTDADTAAVRVQLAQVLKGKGGEVAAPAAQA